MFSLLLASFKTVCMPSLYGKLCRRGAYCEEQGTFFSMISYQYYMKKALLFVPLHRQ